MPAIPSPQSAAHAKRRVAVSLQGDAPGLPFRSLRPATVDRAPFAKAAALTGVRRPVSRPN